MNEERFDRRLADLLDEETLLAVSGSLFDAKPPRRRVWRRAAAVAAAFVLLLGAVNYQSVVAFAQRAYRYFVSGESWVMETPPASYRLCVDPVEAPDGSGGTYRLLQAVQKEDGTLWLSLEHLPSREVKAELSEGAEDVWSQYLTTLKATLQVGEISYPLTYLPEHLGASSPHMSGEEDALANFTVSFAFSCKVEGEADEIALQIGDSRLRTALQPAVAVSAEEISYEGSDNLSFQLMQLTEKGDAIALIPTVKGLSAETCSVNFGTVSYTHLDVYKRQAIAKFKAKGEDAYILAWTTTPWTLPSNVALCVHPDEDYVKVESGGERYYLAAALCESVLGEQGYTVLEHFTGRELEYKEYELSLIHI